jgi:hypothetical protein
MMTAEHITTFGANRRQEEFAGHFHAGPLGVTCTLSLLVAM